MVIGSGGAGKSTVAREIAAATGLPLVHLDRLFWRPGWVPTPTDEWRRAMEKLVAGDRVAVLRTDGDIREFLAEIAG